MIDCGNPSCQDPDCPGLSGGQCPTPSQEPPPRWEEVVDPVRMLAQRAGRGQAPDAAVAPATTIETKTVSRGQTPETRRV